MDIIQIHRWFEHMMRMRDQRLPKQAYQVKTKKTKGSTGGMREIGDT